MHLWFIDHLLVLFWQFNSACIEYYSCNGPCLFLILSSSFFVFEFFINFLSNINFRETDSCISYSPGITAVVQFSHVTVSAAIVLIVPVYCSELVKFGRSSRRTLSPCRIVNVMVDICNLPHANAQFSPTMYAASLCIE